jgi:hypothetical protein
MKSSLIALLVIGVVLLAHAVPVAATPTPEAAPTATAAAPVCNGKYKGRLKPSPDELAEVLKQHAEWVKAGGLFDPKLTNDPRRANLCGANLEGAHLNGAVLTGANLSLANVADADFDFDPDSPPKAVPGIYYEKTLCGQAISRMVTPPGRYRARSSLRTSRAYPRRT